MKKGRVNAKYDEAYTKANRTFPISKTILLVVILMVQIGIIVAAFRFEPKPQDIIRQYDVTVEACEDGSLDISYHFVWQAVDTSEELTWIEIGMRTIRCILSPCRIPLGSIRSQMMTAQCIWYWIWIGLMSAARCWNFPSRSIRRICFARMATVISMSSSPVGSIPRLWSGIPSVGRMMG